MADQNTASSENLIKKISRWLLASAALILVLQLNQVEANAAAGISEVWSETDGMRMKYSTNHGDLLSSKGSEMSLSSDQKHHVEPSAAGGGGESGTRDESAAVAVEGGESQGEESGEQKGEAGEGGSEQADSRKTEKVVPAANPTAGRVHSYSSLAGQTGPAQSSGRSHQHQFRSSASSRSTSEAPSSGYDFSGSTPEDQMVNDNGEVTTTTGGEQSSADAGAADEPLANEAPVGKFRAPGKHFKEAVKMVGSHKQETKADTGDSDSENGGGGGGGDSKDESEEKSSGEEMPSRSKSSADESSDESAEFNAAGDGSWGAALERQAASGKRAQAQEENDYGRPFEGSAAAAAAAGLDTDSPISMAGSPLDQPEQMYNQVTPRNQMMGVSHFGGGEDDEQQMPLSNFRAASPSAGPMFYEGSAQSSRALLAAGGNRERSQPSNAATSAASKRPQSQQTTGGQQAASKQQTYKQLSYFKSVADHPQRAGAAPVPRYPSTVRSSSSSNTAAAPDSPDSVRDNFISPGHYPGSMPHLTQAASEIAQSKSTASNSKEAPSSSPSEVVSSGVAVTSPTAAAAAAATATATTVANEEASKSSSSQQVTTSDIGNQSAQVDSSDTNNQLRGATTTARQSEEQQGQAAAESKDVVSVITVTPSPESQPESQQIMAPILVTTTTMAPLLPTAAPSSTTAAPTGSTTSQTPALKRFKFRKYR